MAQRKHLALVGAGRMGSALARGWIQSGAELDMSIVAPRPSDEVSQWADNGKAALNPSPEPVDFLIIAVKPQVFHDVLATIRPWVGPQTLVVSVMAGITLETMREVFSTQRVVRAMPNTPGAIGQGVTLLCAADDAASVDIDAARKLLEPLGLVEGPMSEEILPLATAVSGCGPAYVFLLAEVMASAAVAEGLPVEMAERLARHTVEGAASLMAASDDSPADLRRAVTSPNGVTAAALDILSGEGGMPSLMKTAQRAAAARDRALSNKAD